MGGSAFFSNISVGYQQGAQKLEGFPGALEPLWWDASGQHTPVPAALAQVEAFQKLLTSSSIPIFEILGRYSLEALAPLYERSALDWSNLEVEFDFFWLPDGKGGFVPHLNEGLLLPANLTEDLEEYPWFR